MKKFLSGFIAGSIIGVLIIFSMSHSITQKDINNEALNANLWLQTSAEYRALCYQAYNTALAQIKSAVRTDKPLAVILDCDETVIDISPLDAACLDTDDNVSFSAWIKESKAGAMPGAYEFLSAVDALSIDIFYVTNRNEKLKADTMRNMKALNFPQIDEAHMLCETESEGKEARFKRIESQYNVILYLGDTAHDFPTGSYRKSVSERNEITDRNKNLYGVKYFVLPNPVYGDWMRDFRGRTPEETHNLKMKALKIYRP